MVVETLPDDEMDAAFRALADATRRDILSRVLLAEESVSGLAANYEMSFAAVQKHVAVLERASLVVKQRRGREQLVHGNPDRILRARLLLDGFEHLWCARAAGIAAILAEDGSAAAPPLPREGEAL
jgi:DNA-binding transcriptional ArsR family regulator